VYDPIYNPNPTPNPFFIDTARGAWGVNMLADTPSEIGYNAAWTSFKGDKHLNRGQTFSTTVLFTPPGAASAEEGPVEAVDFFGQDPAVQSPSDYLGFGHQVLGVYLAAHTTGTWFTLLVHTTISDEHPSVIQTIPVAFTGTAANPQVVEITYTQQAQGHWTLRFESKASSLAGGKTVILTSHEYGATWITTAAESVDAVRYFTSQGGINPGGPLEWESRAVSGAAFQWHHQFFGLSDIGLAKVCLKLVVKMPPPGYWAKAASGVRVTKLLVIALPDGFIASVSIC
jgi:hypothetical protein